MVMGMAPPNQHEHDATACRAAGAVTSLCAHCAAGCQLGSDIGPDIQ